MYSAVRGWRRIAFRSHSFRPHPARAGGGRQQASFASFLAVLPHRQDRRRAAAAERPGDAREEARFRDKPGVAEMMKDELKSPLSEIDSAAGQRAQRGGSSFAKATARQIRSRPRFGGRLAGGGGETPGRRTTSSGGSRRFGLH